MKREGMKTVHIPTNTFQIDFHVNGGRQSKKQHSGRRTEKDKGQMRWHDSLVQKLERTWQLRICLEEGTESVLAWKKRKEKNRKENELVKKSYL